MIDDCGPELADNWVLPASAHLPGRTARPDAGPLFDIARAAPARTEASEWQSNTAYLYGFALYRGAFHWEAHEVWEAVWAGCAPNSRERRLLQALIQIANAELKLQLGRAGAARRLLAQAAQLLDDVVAGAAGQGPAERLMGVDVARLRVEVADAHKRLDC